MNKKYILLCSIYLFLFFSVDACVVKQIHKLRLFDIVGEKCDPLEEGFCLGTLIKVPGDYRPIEDCVVGDIVIDADGEPTPIVAITRKCVDKYIQYFLKNEILYVGYDQLFCLDGTNTWLKAYDLSSHMVHHVKTQSYSSVLLEDFLINNLCSAYNELIMIADYYRACNNECIHRSTTIIRVLEKIIPDILKKHKIIVESKGCIHKDIAEAEKYFASHNIPIVLLKNQVKQGLEQQQRNYEIESLENIEKIVSGGGFSNDPKKNDDDDENIGKECKQVEIYEKNVLHIFRDEIGHFSSDTPANRRTLIQIASDISNFFG